MRRIGANSSDVAEASESTRGLPLSEAERLYRTGQSRTLLAASSDFSGTGGGDQEGARVRIVRAMAQFDIGEVTSSIQSLGLLASDETNGTRTQFEASLALFLRASDFQTPDQLLPSLTGLRQLSAMSGDARALASLHLAVARLEGLRGILSDANRHLSLSRRLASVVGDDALLCTLDLVETSLECIGGNLTRARTLAHQCQQRAQVARFSKYVLGSATNMAALDVYTGRSAKARSRLEEIIAACTDLTYVRFGALDTLAQLEIYEGRLENGKRVIERCASALATDHLPARSWYDMAHQVTRCSYHEQLGDWQQIVQIVDDVDAELARRQYKAVRASLLCAKARALARMGRHAEAQQVLAVAIRSCPRSAVDPLIALEASKALCAHLRGDTSDAAVQFDRALAACRAIGHRYHEHWITALRDDTSRTSRTAVTTPRALDVTDAALLIGDVGTILGAGHSIDLMAHRIASLLQSTTMRSRVEVDSTGNCEFQPQPSASWEPSTTGGFRIRLRGSDRRIDIHIHRVETIEEVSLLKSLADVVQTGVSRAVDTEHDGDDQNLWPQAVIANDEDAVFRSPRMVELLKIATRLASTDLPVLISGETGTGKEIFARLIHERSRHRRGPFIPFNCATVPRDLVESQLFGHRRGAFTGAHESFPGLIRAAERGTLFLDEVGDLDLSAQPKLLRFLENGEIQPLGELRPQRAAVRIVAATNANMDDLVGRGLFRRDLLYRLGVTVLVLPPLRERKDEIPALASFFLAKSSKECGRHGVTLANEYVAALLLYDWPGNIRELSNEVRRAVALANDGDVLGARHLSPDIARLWHSRPSSEPAEPAAPGIHVRLDQTLAQAIRDLESRFIEHALQTTGGRVTDAARLLGLSRKGLFLKRRRRAGNADLDDSAALAETSGG